ncbi:MAG: DUF2795 domain-containing protein [Chloroflexi bacterium]|nr:DUF2795 domain-containing protein [Chloroflexota bacterium]
MANPLNPVQAQKFLKGLDYPVHKGKLVEAARTQGADENVLNTLQSMPERRFNSPNDVTEEIGKLS